LSAPGFGRALAKIALASGVMAAGVGGLLGVLQAVFPAALEGGFLLRLGGVVVLVGGGAGIYFGAATALRLEETAVLRRLAQRLRG
jgi:peptidoglycan biosynthesis protein MviN/MurJ (putative lipid II flippase)